jgi:hypothetical protein
VAENRRLDTPVIIVDGRPLSRDLHALVHKIRVDESVLLPDQLVLSFEDHDFKLFDQGAFEIGTPIEVGFRADQPAAGMVFDGEITEVAVEEETDKNRQHNHYLVVVGLDRTHRMGRVARTRSFVGMNDAAIARQIAGEYGLTADVASRASGKAGYVLQAGQTDSAFLRERANRLGYDVWVSGKTLHFAPNPRADGQPPKLRHGDSLTSFQIRFSSANRCDEVVVLGYDSSGAKTVTGHSSTEDVDRGTTAPAAARMADAAKKAFGRVVRETGGVACPPRARPTPGRPR